MVVQFVWFSVFYMSAIWKRKNTIPAAITTQELPRSVLEALGVGHVTVGVFIMSRTVPFS